jgi:hypothetical protein
MIIERIFYQFEARRRVSRSTAYCLSAGSIAKIVYHMFKIVLIKVPVYLQKEAYRQVLPRLYLSFMLLFIAMHREYPPVRPWYFWEVIGGYLVCLPPIVVHELVFCLNI